MDFDEIQKVLSEWAINKPEIKRVYLFGSRVRGDFTESSDLDVAIELDALPGDSSAMTTFTAEVGGWRSDLQGHIPFKLHLKHLDGDNNPPVKEGVKDARN